MNIAIDIDDTLTDTFDYYIPFVAEFFGADADELRRKNISYNTLPEEWKKKEFALGKAYNDKYIPDAPFKPDAAWGVKKLRELGHRIFIVTARTDDYYENAVKATTKELSNGGIEYDKLICTIDKAGACLAEHISILIDDAPFNCQAAKAAGITPILLVSKAYPNVKADYLRASDWKQAVELIEKIAAEKE